MQSAQAVPKAGVAVADSSGQLRLTYDLADEPRLKVRLALGDRCVQYHALLDSGSSVALLPQHAANALGAKLTSYAQRQGAGHLGVWTAELQRDTEVLTCQPLLESRATWGEPVELAPHFQQNDPPGHPAWSVALGRCDFFASFSVVEFHASNGRGTVVLGERQVNPLTISD